eukprot:3501637-Amphidinium_carterae.2
MDAFVRLWRQYRSGEYFWHLACHFLSIWLFVKYGHCNRHNLGSYNHNELIDLVNAVGADA